MLFARQHTLPFSTVQPMTPVAPGQVVHTQAVLTQVGRRKHVAAVQESGAIVSKPAQLAETTGVEQRREAVPAQAAAPVRAKVQRVDERQPTSLLRSAATTLPAPGRQTVSARQSSACQSSACQSSACQSSACQSSGTASRAGGEMGAAGKVLRLDTNVSRVRRPDRNTVPVAPQLSAEVAVAEATVAGETEPLSTRKRIEHAVEMFGACMLIVAALAITLFA